MEKCVIKCKWEANKEQRKLEEKKAIDEVSENIRSDDKEDEEICNKVYDTETKCLDFRNVRTIEFRNNKRVILPDLDDDLEEIRRNNLKSELRQVVLKYRNDKCDKFGNVFENNLSEAQLKDIKDLNCRIKKEGLACGETDKIGKLTLDTLENISKMMDKHIKDDKVSKEKEVKTLENKLNRHIDF